MATHNIDAVCDHIISRCSETGLYIDLLKLQKLLYYCQAWNLAFGRGRLFDGYFQAWIHGPVSREIYDRFISKRMYAPITIDDMRSLGGDLSEEDTQLISAVLAAYGGMTGDQLEYLTHVEWPWQEARQGVAQNQRSENIINEGTMTAFYKQRICNS